MSFFKRAGLAIIRKKSRTIIMLIILFAIANLILAGVSIQNATESAKILARQKLGCQITLDFDSDKVMQSIMAENTDSETGKVNIKGVADIEYEAITQEMIQTVLNNQNITSYNSIVNTTAFASSFDAVTDSTNEDIKEANESTKQQIEDAKTQAENAQSQVNSFNKEIDSTNAANEKSASDMPGGDRKMQKMSNLNLDFNIDINMANIVSPDITIVGINDYSMEENFVDNTYSIVDGEGIVSYSTEAKSYAMIEETLASGNDLKVGDTITIKATEDGQDIELTIVGIFSAGTSASSGFKGMNVSLAYNKLYVDSATALNIKSINETESADGDSTTNKYIQGTTNSSNGIDSVTFKVNDPANVEEVLEYANNLETIDSNKFVFDANSEEYEQMVEPLNNIASFSKILVIIVAIAGGLIITLILTLWIKERMYETGVLLSLGESKIKIILQYTTEVVLIALIAFALSTVSGKYISQKVGDVLLSNEITATQKEEANQTSEKMQGFSRNNEESEEVEQITQIDVSVNAIVILQLFGIGLLIVIVSSMFPTIIVFRYKPSKILSNS